MDLLVCKQTKVVRTLERSVKRKYPKPTIANLKVSTLIYSLLDKTGVNLDCLILAFPTFGLVFH